MKIYQVGGAVRDKLLGINPQDVDYVVVGATIEKMLSLGYLQVGKNFPVFINPQTKEEYALARKEIKIGDKHTDFKFIFTPDITLKEDLQRRDFTCNALAYDETTNELIDYNHGQEAIEKKILRHVNAKHFVEDPLRVLRMCRFSAQLDFDIDEETISLTKKMVQEGMLENLSAERIWKETEKALQSQHFYKFIEAAKKCNALSYLFPEISENSFKFFSKAENFSAKIKFALFLSVAKDEYEVKNICNRLKVPNLYKNFATMSFKYQNKIDELIKADLPDLIDFIDSITKGKSFDDMEEIFDVFSIKKAHPLIDVKSGLKSFKGYIRRIYNILSSIKASDMSNFESLKNSKELKDLYRLYRIQKVEKYLEK
ncbi:MAG: multifunctional CCA tRNA nucleotidyl transferase/2'3'-cyclic phosphodiesterase/2'nucleotidase/phosphatase [Alphaproteobacteria bacterium]